MSTAKRRHLYRKLATAVFWAALLLGALTSAIFFMTEFKRYSEKTVVMLDQLLDTVESTAAIAAYTSNREIGEDVLKGLLRNDFVHQARLTNDRGLELIETRTTQVPRQAEMVRTLYSPFGEAEVIGHLLIVPETQYNLQEARHSALLSALNSSVLIGLTALIVLSLVRSSLSRPLIKVSDALHAITAGEQERLDLLSRHRDDELGQLVDDINNLLDTLQEKFTVEHSLREEIQSVEQQLSSLFETTSAGIFLLDATGNLLKTNPTLGRVLGLPGMTSEKLVGQNFPALAFAEPERLRELMRYAGERRLAVGIDLELKSSGDAPSGWVHCLVSGQTDATGAARFEGVVYDVTERKKMEEEIKTLNEELECKVRERTQQLLEAQDELIRKEKLAVLGQVAGSVGHELRNPLAVMNNAVYFLQTVMPDADEIIKEYLNIIKGEIEGSTRIVSDLLDSVRTKPPRTERVEVRELLEKTLDKCIVPPTIAVKWDIPETLPALKADPQQIHQVFRNLISNGIEAMPEGGVLEIQAAADEAEKMINLEIRDSGVGMTPEQLGKLFQPLFTTKARGIGLGLVVVKNLTQANGGTVKVESEPGQGTVFTVSLPMDAAAAEVT